MPFLLFVMSDWNNSYDHSRSQYHSNRYHGNRNNNFNNRNSYNRHNNTSNDSSNIYEQYHSPRFVKKTYRRQDNNRFNFFYCIK